jgi:hypothetical protein
MNRSDVTVRLTAERVCIASAFPSGFFVQSGVFNGAAHLAGNGGQKFQRVFAVGVGFFVLNVDDAHHPVFHQNRNGKERLELVFRQVVEKLKPMVFVRFFGNRQRFFMFGHPPGQPFPHAQAQLVDFAGDGAVWTPISTRLRCEGSCR